MKSLLMTLGMFLLIAGGEFLKVGSSVSAYFHVSPSPAIVYMVIAAGCGCIIECAHRTSPT